MLQLSADNGKKNNNIFIIYSDRYIEYANRLYNDLVKFGLKPWRYKEDILLGQNIDLEVKKWIKKIKVFYILAI